MINWTRELAHLDYNQRPVYRYVATVDGKRYTISRSWDRMTGDGWSWSGLGWGYKSLREAKQGVANDVETRRRNERDAADPHDCGVCHGKPLSEVASCLECGGTGESPTQ